MRLLPTLFVLTSVLSMNPLSAQVRDDTGPKGISELAQRLELILQKTRTPGASVALVSREKVLWTAGFGKADLSDGTPASAETLFRIGSITKSFAALGVMMLVEEGRLSLEDRLASVAPEVEFSNPWESTDPVRVVHILEHTAGWNMHSLLEAAYDDPAAIDLRDALALRPATRASRWKPGTGFAYSNVGAPVAAYIIERLTGRRFEEFVQERIFHPLGMMSATFFAPVDAASRLATGYDPHLRRVNYRNLLFRPAGAVSASAQDMAALVRLYLNRGSLDGKTLVKPETMDRIESPFTSLAARNGIRLGYGLFNHTRDHKGFTFHGHTGGVDGFGAEMFYLPEAGLGYAFMINNFSGSPFYQMGQVLRDYVIKDMPRPELPASVSPVASQLSFWAGYYEPQNPPIEYFRLTNRLMGVMLVRANGGQLAVEPMLGGNSRKLAMMTESLFRSADSVHADTLFTRDESGARLMAANQGSIFRQVPGWRAWGRLALGMLCIALMISPLPRILWWSIRRFLGKAQGPRPPGLGIWPLAAALSLVGMMALNSVTGETAWRLAYLTPYSAGLFVLSLLLPAASFLGLVEVIRATNQVPGRLRWLYWLACSVSSCVVSAYLGINGILGLRTWNL